MREKFWNILIAVSRKRKKKNWEDEDYYDSDDDTFLDRTGTVEKKREERMKKAGKIEEQPDTFDSLVKASTWRCSVIHSPVIYRMTCVTSHKPDALCDITWGPVLFHGGVNTTNTPQPF